MAKKRSWLGRHSLSLVAVAILALWIVLYSRADEKTHVGAFFGNAIADWTGLVVMVIATKYLYERGSKESKQPRGLLPKRWEKALRDHSLTVFLVITGALWIALYAHLDSEAKWGQVVGNIVSEWTQILGLVLMTKKLMEAGSKESG
jgi:membrane protease YdiL (CAAX protease family)